MKLAYKINNSPGLLEEVEKSCNAARIKLLCMVKPVNTHWNSKFQMISHALHLKLAIEDICTQKSLVAQYSTCPLKITQEEWRILEELDPLLGISHQFFFALAFQYSFLFYRLSMTYLLKCRLQESL